MAYIMEFCMKIVYGSSGTLEGNPANIVVWKLAPRLSSM